MLYSCTNMATVGVKGLSRLSGYATEEKKWTEEEHYWSTTAWYRIADIIIRIVLQNVYHKMSHPTFEEWISLVRTNRLYSAIHVGIRWKIRHRRQIKNRHY